jgi:hypothetical protein
MNADRKKIFRNDFILFCIWNMRESRADSLKKRNEAACYNGVVMYEIDSFFVC